MKGRAWMLPAAVAAVAIALFLSWPRERELASARPRAGAIEEQPERTAVEVPDAPAIREPVVAPRDAPAQESISGAAPLPVSRAETLELSGSLVVLDPDGFERDWQRASFVLAAWHGDGGTETRVEAADGQWAARATCAQGSITHLSADQFVVDGSRATLEAPRGEIAVPADRRVDLRVRLPRTTTLRVLASDTGADLDGIVLARCAAFPHDEDAHPGSAFEERVLARDLHSPIDLEQHLGSTSLSKLPALLVGSEGYAWTRTVLDTEHGGERTVTLERGGLLVLSVVGAADLPDDAPPAPATGEWRDDRPARVELRLWRGDPSDKPLLSEALGRRDRLEISGLLPGHYWARAEVGDWWNKPVVLGEVELDIAAGTRTNATLAVVPPQRVEGVHVTGRVWMPSEWKSQRVLVTAQLLDTAQAGFESYLRAYASAAKSERAGYDRFDWSLSHVQPGRYELGVFDPPASIAVVVEPRAEQELELVVAPPVEVSIQVVDADTGADLAVAAVMWHPVRPKGSQGGGVESARRDPQSGRYEFRAPQGTLRIWAQDPRFSAENRAPDDAAPLSVTSQGVDYVAAPESLVVAGARVEHTLRLRPNCGFVLRLKYGTSAVPFGEEERVRCRALLGDGRAIGAYREDGAWRFVVSEPGAYELAFPRIARYAPIPTQTVTVLAAQFVEHVVALEREHP